MLGLNIDSRHQWKQLQFHLGTREKLNEFCKEFLPKMQSFPIRYYFNRYSTKNSDGEETAFLKFGLLNVDAETEGQIVATAIVLGATVKQGNPDLRLQGELRVDDLKYLSTETAVKIFGLQKPTIPQIYLYIHLLMNQLGFSYPEELDLYLTLAYKIRFDRRM